MSATTTANPITATTLSLLGDYEVHHSEQQETVHANVETRPSLGQPPDWPRDHRRVPAYRPINYNLDQSERPAGSNGVEWAFIEVMLHGVWLNSVGHLELGICPTQAE
ncbi:hypothetical protein BDQ94DRAFT_172358 [Aspergillus welwitschiae]|uniref:Uncharacterized protein n=1 Tax=Aspergillus welwitschiae TaxID=1341132 RepID=A0A3F3PWC7_9EURO|nr:hypothetical protein BDQ94DRAFT_172358 [Aspergillus welwitschiae]RDH31260.1 hypothetical protein BDQ94DRAFT_172358 [Aspergillus welwitschiae]